ncbi:MAG TPA: Fic family protein, partial [Vicinamibacteria bacterium]|nr:Fic family protein [Vicinamibacteria bacterium]
MSEERPLRIATSAAVRERRLASLLAGRDAHDPRWRWAAQDAQVAGSLALSGIDVTAAEVAAARSGAPAPPAVQALLRALAAVEPASPLSVEALCRWQAVVTGGPGALRTGELERAGGPPPSPARFVEARLRMLEKWLAEESGRELKPAQQGALAMARVVEILPFPQGNGRVAR